ncbi:MAG: hypothetical protein E7Z70_07290 [Thermoplasmata archaeon]|nr:hypothetical protein [Thermoplasmata archaeon]
MWEDNPLSNGITFLLGAGSNLDFANNLSSSKLTPVVLCNEEYYGESSTGNSKIEKMIGLIHCATEYLDQKLGKSNYSFEEVIQFLVDIHSQKSGWSFNPITMEIPETVADFDADTYGRAIAFILGKVYNSVASSFWDNPPEWYKGFFDSIKEHFTDTGLSLFTLNYDCYLDRAIVNFNDGFVQKGLDYFVFSPEKATTKEPGIPLLNHLHGSVQFNYNPQEEKDIRYAFV